MYQPQKRLACLMGRSSVPINLIVPHGIVGLPAPVAGVALHGVDDTIFHFLYDTYMVGYTILRPGVAAQIVPIKENQSSGRGS